MGGLDKDAYKAIDEVVDEKTFNAIAKTQDVLDLSIADPYAKLLSKLGDVNIIEKIAGKIPKDKLSDFIKDLESADFSNLIIKNLDMADAWTIFKNAELEILARNPLQLQKFNDLVKNNQLGLELKGFEDLLLAPKVKGLRWDNPDGVLDAIKRASDAKIDFLSINHKNFPEAGSDNFVLKNAKQYQTEASGDAALSFNKGGVSFDDVASDGKLVDRKWGHGKSIFDEERGVINESRAQSLLDQAQRQMNAVGGDASKIRWEISTPEGLAGIKNLFLNNNIEIEVVHKAQMTIIGKL